MYQKRPTKKQLYESVDYLTEENVKLHRQLNKEQIKVWETKRPLACETFYQQIRKVFPFGVIKVTFEHVDVSGYWFTFELVNDSTRQTYCVRHTDLR